MASGFIILEDGRGWSRNWAWYDLVLENISIELAKTSKGCDLSVFLKSLLPEAEDIEAGWGFVKPIDGETIRRYLDLRELKQSQRDLFWYAAKRTLKVAFSERLRNEDLIFALTILLKMHKSIAKGELPSCLNDLIAIIPKTENKIGPGW